MITNLEKPPRIILASQSKIRRRAMDILGLQYECIPSNIDEKAIRHENPHTMAVLLSEAKARAVSAKEHGIIVAADACICLGKKILEKPETMEEAYTMLRDLSGNQHRFITGLAVYDTVTEKMRSTATSCSISLRTISEAEIQDYCSRYPVLTLAGGIETDGVVRFSEKIEGSCNLVTALPMPELVQFLQEISHEHAAVTMAIPLLEASAIHTMNVDTER